MRKSKRTALLRPTDRLAPGKRSIRVGSHHQVKQDVGGKHALGGFDASYNAWGVLDFQLPHSQIRVSTSNYKELIQDISEKQELMPGTGETTAAVSSLSSPFLYLPKGGTSRVRNSQPV